MVYEKHISISQIVFDTKYFQQMEWKVGKLEKFFLKNLNLFHIACGYKSHLFVKADNYNDVWSADSFIYSKQVLIRFI